MLQQVAKQCVCACQQWLLAFGILYGQASKLIKKEVSSDPIYVRALP
jgi:Fe2+ transport system protein FeoA